MYKRFAVAFTFVAALTFANAANTYSVDLYKPTVLNGVSFKPGSCKLEIKDNQVVLKQGKHTAQAAVKVENAKEKFISTSVGYGDGDQINEIRLGGTNMKLLVGTSGDSSAPAGR